LAVRQPPDPPHPFNEALHLFRGLPVGAHRHLLDVQGNVRLFLARQDEHLCQARLAQGIGNAMPW
jgi:hypothetical protein